ncbi:unnamed protein product [Prorocentrum cordatum]|uniref:Uncharacterized protein n=1 Tax=Prorocentrum cordatum TaxID=2364126 RepID=A0ABN9S3W4_9DINO|nr:unnamed protein product [Polarella glacialis]
MPGANVGNARELFDIGKARGEDVHVTVTPYDREEGRSWRHTKECVLLTEPPASGLLRPRATAVAALLAPLAISLLAARWSSCWLLSLPGLLLLCLSSSSAICLRTGSEIHKLWNYWDGRVQFVQDWPAAMFARSACAVVLFALALGLSLGAAALCAWGARAWAAGGACPF